MSYTPQQPANPQDERTWAVLIHVLGIFFSFIPSLIGYLFFKDRGPFIRQHAAAALNFQITMAIAGLIGSFTTFILIGFLILFAVAVVELIFSIVAAFKASQGEAYVYPLSIKFVQ